MKYAIVTGSTKGIGKAIGIQLLKNGYFLIFNYSKDEESAYLLQSEIQQYKDKYTIIKQDLSNLESVEKFTQACMKYSAKIDVLVLNAGVTDRTPWEDLSWDGWNKCLNVNLTVPAFLAREIGKNITNGGTIIFIGSDLGIYPHATSVPYAVSKAAVHMLAKSLVKEYAKRKIRVNAIAPGFVDTSWQKEKPEAQRKRIENKTALGRFAIAEEIAQLTFDVIENGYINGSIIEINGGYNYK